MPATVLVLVILAAALAAEDTPSGAQRASTARHRVIDIPRAIYRPAGKPVRPPLRRVVDLLQLAWEGQGSLSRTRERPPQIDSRVTLTPLPWAEGERQVAQLTTRTLGVMSEEAALSLVLRPEDRWCAPSLDLPSGSRLRLSAVGLSGAAQLRASWKPPGGAVWATTVRASPSGEVEDTGVDEELPAGAGTLCLESSGGVVSAGEPRIVAPEPLGSDPRPRWIVLVVEDTLRADALDDPALGEVAPALEGLQRRGQRYTEALSTGAHTKAALWPLLMGRDLARIDPFRARYSRETDSPWDVVYSRANLSVSHLAQDAGYHTVFLGNNSFLREVPAFARFSNWGRSDTGTVDTITALPRIMERYADERVLLVYYISAPHSGASTPSRLYQRFGCPRLEGLEASRCAYRARIAHGDEALMALQEALADRGLERSTFQLLTADHGEIFDDARRLEILEGDRWWGTAEGHGATSHQAELHVPLLVSGPGLGPGVWPGRVSILDVVPTLARVGGFPAPLRLDGSVLPAVGTRGRGATVLVSHGYCTHSVIEGDQQLLWWEAECPRRVPGETDLLTHRAEVWSNGVMEATDESAPGRVAPLVRAHLRWLAERLPGEAWMIDASRLGPARLTVTVPEGRIVDWGPSRSMGRFDAVSPRLSADERRLEIDLTGFPGRFYVATWPPSAPVRFEVVRADGGLPVTFTGALQLPLDVLGRLVDPGLRSDLWVSPGSPDRQPSVGPSLRIWREPYGLRAAPSSGRAPSEIDRVLREWGYIR